MAVAEALRRIERPLPHPMGSARPFVWCLVPLVVFVLVILVLPLVYMARLSTSEFVLGSTRADGFTVAHYARVLMDSYYYRVIAQTAFLSLVVTLLSLLLGFPVAYYLARVSSRWRGFLIFLVILPIMVGIVVRSYGWIVLLAREGVVNQVLVVAGLVDAPIRILNTWTAVVIALTEIMLPFMILPLTAALERVDPVTEEAARTMGAGRLRVLSEVIVPLAAPGIVSGSILVFSLSMTAYATPAMLGGPSATVVASLIVQQMLTTFNWPLGSALAIVLILLTTAATVGGVRVSRVHAIEARRQ